MRTPRKIWLLVSRKTKAVVDEYDVFFSHKEAKEECEFRNDPKAQNLHGTFRWDNNDWVIEPFCKGD